MDFSNFWFFPSSISALETARLGEAPIPADGCHGDVESFGGFFLAQSAEETHLHDPAFSRIDFLELSQGLVQRQHVGALWYGHTGGFDEGHLYRFAAALQTIATARAVHEHPPHHVGGHAEKVGAVRPLDVLPVHQAEIRFVDQRSWLLSGRVCAVRSSRLLYRLGICASAFSQIVEHASCTSCRIR